VVALCLVLGCGLAACRTGTATTLSSPPTTDPLLTLALEQSPAGEILIAGTGRTLYDFGPDSPTHSACVNDGCVYQWPPLGVPSTIRVGAGVERNLVGSIKRSDGSLQLTYGGHPLYTYIRDTKPGLITGQAIDQDGGPWYVLGRAGNQIRTPFTVDG
jgi:predicted lipoprotein with Yx(FWY)xxD motif